MNLLFIEDKIELSVIALSQLERIAHTVYPAVNITVAREILSDESKSIQMMITYHRLPDGLGIQFAVEIKDTYAEARSAIVSGCLTDDNIKEIEAHSLLYFRKLLLYGKAFEAIRRQYSLKANVYSVEEPPVESDEDTTKKNFWALIDKKNLSLRIGESKASWVRYSRSLVKSVVMCKYKDAGGVI
ncbi:MAG: hypothetical protein ACN4GF_08535 [Lentimonas sp.]